MFAALAKLSGINSLVLNAAASQLWLVPAGVYSGTLTMCGGSGGNGNGAGTRYGGEGARLQGTIILIPGQLLNITIGGTGASGITLTRTQPDGGKGDGYNAKFAGSGGGSTSIRIGNALVAIAGGGGGAGTDCDGG